MFHCACSTTRHTERLYLQTADRLKVRKNEETGACARVKVGALVDICEVLPRAPFHSRHCHIKYLDGTTQSEPITISRSISCNHTPCTKLTPPGRDSKQEN